MPTEQKNWKTGSGPKLLNLIVGVSAMAIAHEGMSQGVMGAVNVAPEYQVCITLLSSPVTSSLWLIWMAWQQRMGFADGTGKITNPSLQGGIVSIYYAGSLLGAFWAGQFSDRYGRTLSLPYYPHHEGLLADH
jgi:hypothetical protein